MRRIRCWARPPVVLVRPLCLVAQASLAAADRWALRAEGCPGTCMWGAARWALPHGHRPAPSGPSQGQNSRKGSLASLREATTATTAAMVDCATLGVLHCITGQGQGGWILGPQQRLHSPWQLSEPGQGFRGLAYPGQGVHTRGAQRLLTTATASTATATATASTDSQPWLLSESAAVPRLTQVSVGTAECGFTVIRDDLLHPIASGNKLRKLDAIVPLLCHASATHVVTCGGVQSAHAAAVASVCAEHSIEAHLVLRGEPPAVPTGYCLLSHMFGVPHYVSRTAYANRAAVLQACAERVAGADGMVLSLEDCARPRDRSLARGRVVVIINEGAADAWALLGLVRLARLLGESGWKHRRCCLVVDSGTGTSAIGLALGIRLLKLPWRVIGVMLAGNEDYYKSQAGLLADAFHAHIQSSFSSYFRGIDASLSCNQTRDEGRAHAGGAGAEVGLANQRCSEDGCLPLTWIPRAAPRRFGKVFPKEIERCRGIARRQGILLDPVYTLAAWEICESLIHSEESPDLPHEAECAQNQGKKGASGQNAGAASHEKKGGIGTEGERSLGDARTSTTKLAHGEAILMLHTGGSLGLQGLAQQHPKAFLSEPG